MQLAQQLDSSTQPGILSPVMSTTAVRKTAYITAREIGSRRITAANIRALATELADAATYSEEPSLQVHRFHTPDILTYPLDQVHRAVEDYDVKRIVGTLYPDTNGAVESIGVDICPAWTDSAFPIFTITGEISEVNKVCGSIRDHTLQWCKTNHALWHGRLPAPPPRSYRTS